MFILVGDAANSLEALSGEVPCFAGPEEGLANTALEYAEPVGERGVGSEDVPESVKFTPSDSSFDAHVLGGVVLEGKGAPQYF